MLFFLVSQRKHVCCGYSFDKHLNTSNGHHNKRFRGAKNWFSLSIELDSLLAGIFFHDFCCLLISFNVSFKKSFRCSIRVSNSFDLDQEPCFVIPDLGPYFLQRLRSLSADSTSRQRVNGSNEPVTYISSFGSLIPLEKASR